MRTTLRTLAGVCLVGTGGAAAGGVTVIDVSGLSSWGVLGDPSNGVLGYQDTPRFFPFIVGIDYALSVRTFGGSWLSDLGVRVSNSDGSFFVEEFFPGVGQDQAGSALLSGSFATDIFVNPDGIVRIELFELRDDVVGGVDATLLSGSTMTMSYFIPGPGALGVLGAVGVVGLRRRR